MIIRLPGLKNNEIDDVVLVAIFSTSRPPASGFAYGVRDLQKPIGGCAPKVLEVVGKRWGVPAFRVLQALDAFDCWQVTFAGRSDFVDSGSPGHNSAATPWGHLCPHF